MITNLNSDFTLKNGLLGGDKLAKSDDWDKYIFSGYGIGFDSHSEISLLDGSSYYLISYVNCWHRSKTKIR